MSETIEVDIDAIEAGRILDALIAERVMGWTFVSHNCYVPYGKDTCGYNPSGKGGFHNDGRMPIPKYSTEIAAAWEVVEKLELAVLPAIYDGYKWAACTDAEGYYYSDKFCSQADTAPLAICRAALEVVGRKL